LRDGGNRIYSREHQGEKKEKTRGHPVSRRLRIELTILDSPQRGKTTTEGRKSKRRDRDRPDLIPKKL